MSHIYHAAVAKGKALVATGKKVAARTIAVVRKTVTVVRHVASVTVAKVSDVYHAAATYAVRAVLPVARAAAGLGAFAVHVVAASFHQATAAVALLKRAAGATVKAAASFMKKHPVIRQFAAGAASVVTGLAKGAVAQAEHNASILQGCASGSLGDCGQVWNMTGTSGMASAALQGAQGTVTAAGSIYRNVSDGHISYAAGQITAIAGIFAITRGIGDTLTPETAGTAGATASSANWLSRLLEPKPTAYAHATPEDTGAGGLSEGSVNLTV